MNPSTKIGLLIIVALTINCSKNKNYNPNTNSKTICATEKQISHNYKKLEDIVKNNNQYKNIQEFLMNHVWVAEYENSYIVAYAKDTISRENSSCRTWQFEFNKYSNIDSSYYGKSGQTIRYYPQGGGDIRNFLYTDNAFVLDYYPGNSNTFQNDTFQIVSSTQYVDSSFSFTMKHFELEDSIYKISDIKIYTKNKW